MLVCRNLSVERDGRLLFQPFSIQVAAGQVLTLEGPSGLGKSTLLGALVGPLPGISLSGDVHLHGLTWSSVPVQAGAGSDGLSRAELVPAFIHWRECCARISGAYPATRRADA